jgi:hypothetical protein
LKKNRRTSALPQRTISFFECAGALCTIENALLIGNLVDEFHLPARATTNEESEELFSMSSLRSKWHYFVFDSTEN